MPFLPRVVIIGAGIAGASLAYRLAERFGDGQSIILIEREDLPGYHTTGRSAAVYTETYGPPLIRALTAASRSFFDSPPEGFAEFPLLHRLGLLLIAPEHRLDRCRELFQACHALTPTVRMLARPEILAMLPVLRPEWAVGAVFEPDAMSMDVAAIHQGYLRLFKRLGGTIRCDAGALALPRQGSGFVIETTAGNLDADIVVNATGAWADEVAALAGLAPLGLQPKRRTIIVFQGPPGVDVRNWPMVNDIDETFYFKPDAGRILASPEEATPMPPCDAQPDEFDVAVAVDRLQNATTLEIKRIDNKWAGLRSFFPDGNPALGFDPRRDGFFWLAGQGGYGITTSDAMARMAAAIISGADVPDEISALGVTAEALAPGRLIAGN